MAASLSRPSSRNSHSLLHSLLWLHVLAEHRPEPYFCSATGGDNVGTKKPRAPFKVFNMLLTDINNAAPFNVAFENDTI